MSDDPTPHRLAYFILKSVNEAVRDFDMLRPGDRIAVAVSGGKDSLSLLRLLQTHHLSFEKRYTVAAIHVRGDATGITQPYAPLEELLAGLGVPYRIVEPEVGAADALPLSCQRCTWLRRKALFLAAAEMGCNVIAYAHHADDAAQTTLLNLLYGGDLRTLQPAAAYFGGKFRLIRPLIYVPESELARFARICGFPPPPPACPRAGDSRRKLIADMLKLLGRDYLKQARPNLIRAGLAGRPTNDRRLKTDDRRLTTND
jgi:tRNA 2-thiocytidine biosynthesis protein TtcA